MCLFLVCMPCHVCQGDLMGKQNSPLPPLPDHPDFQYSGLSSGDTRGSLGTRQAAGLIPESLVREVATQC